MRLFLLLWLAPGTLFWSWHLLSSRDLLFSRDFHDEVFQIYGDLLSVEPSAIPSMFAHAFLTDSLLVFALLGIRKRQAVKACARRVLTILRRHRWLRADRAPLAG